MNFIERCLYDFNDNIDKIHNLSFMLHNLLSVQAQGYNVHIYNSENDPVTDVIIRKERIENHIKRIKMKIIPVKNLDDSLSVHEIRTHQMKDILHKKYWLHKSIDDILSEIGISKSTLKRRNRELLQRAKDFFHDFHHDYKDN
ncbi:MAG: hypothetical protein IJQ77_06860 [Synergistaceae bacterium]|nr:hypothetical protein [Synergistaceae bacterium]MBR0250786.1 hypothetical protein [Synergistaceae bacterium]